MEIEIIKTKEELRKLYKPVMGLGLKKQMNKLDKHSIQFLNLSPFLILSTSNNYGHMDCSPRGDYPGFVGVLDDYTIVIPDRPGNNRLDTLSNIIEKPNVGVLLLVPGFDECLRINGSAIIATNIELLQRFEYRGRLPKSVIVISIKELYFHCAKAITRANLWEDEFNVDRNIMPSFGRILMNQIDSSTTDEEIKEVENIIENRVKTTLY
jgi:PPOX class probable FMN-dependent enzyme